MYLSLSRKFLFVHIAKTGGSSIRARITQHKWRDPLYWPQFVCHRISHLYGHRLGVKLPRHAPVSVAKEMIPISTFRQLYKFAFVRNPWDRIVSAYCHFLRERQTILRTQNISEFDEFVRWLVFDSEDYKNDGATFIQALRRPQWQYVTDLEGRLEIDFVGRFESLNEDFLRIAETLQLANKALPHKRKSNRSRDYRSFYSDISAELVSNHFRDDVANFGYDFEKSNSRLIASSVAA